MAIMSVASCMASNKQTVAYFLVLCSPLPLSGQPSVLYRRPRKDAKRLSESCLYPSPLLDSSFMLSQAAPGRGGPGGGNAGVPGVRGACARLPPAAPPGLLPCHRDAHRRAHQVLKHITCNLGPKMQEQVCFDASTCWQHCRKCRASADFCVNFTCFVAYDASHCKHGTECWPSCCFTHTRCET